METESKASTRLMEFIQSELVKEEARRTSIESRGFGIVTVASGLLAILAAIRQLGGVANQSPPAAGLAQGVMAAGAALLIAGVLAAACTNAPRRYRLVDPEAIRSIAPSLWVQDVDALNRTLFASLLAFLNDAQRINDGRARLLFFALLSLGLGVVTLAILILDPSLSAP